MSEANVANTGAKIAIVTGGSRGLGRNTVLNLARRGVSCIFTYNSNRAEADTLITEVSETGAKAIALQLDAGKIRTFDAFVQSVAASLVEMGAERFDYLVNNAGTSHHAPFDKVTEEDFDSLYNVHFKGVFLPHAEASAADERWRKNRDDLVGTGPIRLSGKLRLCLHEGCCRGAYEIPGERTRSTRHRREHRGSGRHRD